MGFPRTHVKLQDGRERHTGLRLPILARFVPDDDANLVGTFVGELVGVFIIGFVAVRDDQHVAAKRDPNISDVLILVSVVFGRCLTAKSRA